MVDLRRAANRSKPVILPNRYPGLVVRLTSGRTEHVAYWQDGAACVVAGYSWDRSLAAVVPGIIDIRRIEQDLHDFTVFNASSGMPRHRSDLRRVCGVM